MGIFAGLSNSSTTNSTDSSSVMAEVGASIGVLDVMSSASQNIDLEESVFPVSPCQLLLHLL